MNYGSRNTEEESAFIRRVVAPPKRNDNSRRKQKRMAAVGGAVALFAAGAVCTYVAMPEENLVQSVSTEMLDANTGAESAFVVPDEATESAEGATYVPKFLDYDTNDDGVISNDEYQARLEKNRDEAMASVQASNLSDEDKEVYAAHLVKNYEKELACVTRLANKTAKKEGQVTADRFELFYTLLTEFCVSNKPLELTKLPQTSLVVDTPNGPEVVEIPAIEEGEPTTTVVVDTPSGPVAVEIPLVTDETTETTTIVVDTPSGPTVIEVPEPDGQNGDVDIADIIEGLGGYSDDESLPETSIVVDTPSGPTVIDLPIITEDYTDPTTTVVVDTPSGPVAVEIPLVTDETTETTTIVVDTPSGPTVIEVPEVTDTPVMAPGTKFMTKPEFKVKIGGHFDKQFDELDREIAFAEVQLAKATQMKEKLEDCVIQASEKFGWYGVYEHDDVFDSAVKWVATECMAA